MSILTDASLIITPNAYKAGSLLAVVPSNGNGDLTWTRNSGATRVNSAGLIENVLANVPRLDYSQGSCPNILLEPQRTNRLLNSETLVTQSISTTGLVCAVSFYGTGTITFSGTFTGTLVGTGANNRVSIVFTPTTGTLTLTVSGSVTKAQLEAGAYPTSYIPTTSATVTRVADTFSRNNIFTNGLISASGGTWFVEIENNLAYTRDGLSTGLFIDSNINAFTNGFNIRNTGGVNSRLVLSKWYPLIGGLNIFTTTTDRVKLAITWSATTANVFVNGVKVVTNTAFLPTSNIQHLSCINSLNVPFYIKQMWLENVPMTDVQLIAATTL